jgi:hypothetical protein
MPVFFGSILFLLASLAAAVLLGIVFLPAGPIWLAIALVLFVAARRGRGADDANPPGPQARWREEAAAANE